jgi:hypothetical protein
VSCCRRHTSTGCYRGLRSTPRTQAISVTYQTPSLKIGKPRTGAFAGPARVMEPDERYTLQSRIGRGSFGEVFRGVDRTTQQIVAIKIIDLDQVRRSSPASTRSTAGSGPAVRGRTPATPQSAFTLLAAHRAAGRAAGGG